MIVAARPPSQSFAIIVDTERRVSPSEVMTLRELYPPLEPGELLRGTRDARFAQAWEMASPTTFRPLKVTGIAVLRQA